MSIESVEKIVSSLAKARPTVAFSILGLLIIVISNIDNVIGIELIPSGIFKTSVNWGGLFMFLLPPIIFFVQKKPDNTQSDLQSVQTYDSEFTNIPAFENHISAQPKMKEIINESIKNNQKTTIRVIGVALKYSWPFLEATIKPYLVDDFLKDKFVKFEFALLDKDWEPLKEFEQWHLANESAESGISIFYNRNLAFVNRNELDVILWKYRHFPAQHGVLINNKTLFQSSCKWTKRSDGKFDLTVGENRYEMFQDEDEKGTQEIKDFNVIFDFYESKSKKCDL